MHKVYADLYFSTWFGYIDSRSTKRTADNFFLDYLPKWKLDLVNKVKGDRTFTGCTLPMSTMCLVMLVCPSSKENKALPGKSKWL